jgi:hypothetical protein
MLGPAKAGRCLIVNMFQDRNPYWLPSREPLIPERRKTQFTGSNSQLGARKALLEYRCKISRVKGRKATLGAGLAILVAEQD